MTKYVRRVNGKIVLIMPVPYIGYADEAIADDSPELAAVFNPVYTAAEILAIDTATLNAALVEPGSVVRALGLVMFDEINKLRVLNGDPVYTLAQFQSALKARMR
jgi:hypothetical protein